MTHDELCLRACKWLRGSKGCSVVISELVACTGWGEIPDAIGFRSDYSILVECKTSRSDFLADKKKIFRQREERGMGVYRFYLCESGIITPEDLPEKWGLLYVAGKRIKTLRGGLLSNIHSSAKNTPWQNNNHKKGEIALLVSALRRKNQ